MIAVWPLSGFSEKCVDKKTSVEHSQSRTGNSIVRGILQVSVIISVIKPLSAVATTIRKNKSFLGNMQILGNQFIIFHKILLFRDVVVYIIIQDHHFKLIVYEPRYFIVNTIFPNHRNHATYIGLK